MLGGARPRFRVVADALSDVVDWGEGWETSMYGEKCLANRCRFGILGL